MTDVKDDEDETTKTTWVSVAAHAVLILGGAGLIVLGNQHQLIGNGGMHTFLMVIGVLFLLSVFC